MKRTPDDERDLGVRPVVLGDGSIHEFKTSEEKYGFVRGLHAALQLFAKEGKGLTVDPIIGTVAGRG